MVNRHILEVLDRHGVITPRELLDHINLITETPWDEVRHHLWHFIDMGVVTLTHDYKVRLAPGVTINE